MQAQSEGLQGDMLKPLTAHKQRPVCVVYAMMRVHSEGHEGGGECMAQRRSDYPAPS